MNHLYAWPLLHIQHPYFDPETGEEEIMQGQTTFGGCLATIVPADKKKIHGMKDGILLPCMVG